MAQERKKAAQEGLRFLRLTGADIQPRHWDAFHRFYLNTTDRKWGSAYLTRDFFSQLGERMGYRVLLVLAETADGAAGHGRPIAGALNLIGSHALFGRNWGCLLGDRIPNLHFELCYYQACGGGGPGVVGTECISRHMAAADATPSRHKPPSSLRTSVMARRRWSLPLSAACSAWRRGRRASTSCSAATSPPSPTACTTCPTRALPAWWTATCSRSGRRWSTR